MTSTQTDQEFVFIVEQIQDHDTVLDGPGDLLARSALAYKIDLDQKSKTGLYRQHERYFCGHCRGKKDSEKSVLATTYIGPDGEPFIKTPPRLFSNGHDMAPMRITAQAISMENLGFISTQCKQCTEFFVLIHYWLTSDDGRKSMVMIYPVEEATFGEIRETGTRSVTYKIVNDGPLKHINRR